MTNPLLFSSSNDLMSTRNAWCHSECYWNHCDLVSEREERRHHDCEVTPFNCVMSFTRGMCLLNDFLFSSSSKLLLLLSFFDLRYHRCCWWQFHYMERLQRMCTKKPSKRKQNQQKNVWQQKHSQGMRDTKEKRIQHFLSSSFRRFGCDRRWRQSVHVFLCCLD